MAEGETSARNPSGVKPASATTDARDCRACGDTQNSPLANSVCLTRRDSRGAEGVGRRAPLAPLPHTPTSAAFTRPHLPPSHAAHRPRPDSSHKSRPLTSSWPAFTCLHSHSEFLSADTVPYEATSAINAEESSRPLRRNCVRVYCMLGRLFQQLLCNGELPKGLPLCNEGLPSNFFYATKDRYKGRKRQVTKQGREGEGERGNERRRRGEGEGVNGRGRGRGGGEDGKRRKRERGGGEVKGPGSRVRRRKQTRRQVQGRLKNPQETNTGRRASPGPVLA